MDEVSRGAVDSDHSAAARTRDHVGLDPGAIGDVNDYHLLTFEQVRGLHKRDVERYRADIIQVGLRHRRAVDLRFHHDPHHGNGSSGLAAAGRYKICIRSSRINAALQ